MQPSPEMRQQAATAIMEKMGELLVRITSNESGRIVETIIQLLPDEVFKTLAYLIIGNENDEISRGLVFELVFRIANKLGLEFDNPEPLTDAASNIFVIINCENLRRKGHVEYLCSNDIFTSHPDNPGFNKLTDTGKQIYYQQFLEQDNPGISKYKM